MNAHVLDLCVSITKNYGQLDASYRHLAQMVKDQNMDADGFERLIQRFYRMLCSEAHIQEVVQGSEPALTKLHARAALNGFSGDHVALTSS